MTNSFRASDPNALPRAPVAEMSVDLAQRQFEAPTPDTHVGANTGTVSGQPAWFPTDSFQSTSPKSSTSPPPALPIPPSAVATPKRAAAECDDKHDIKRPKVMHVPTLPASVATRATAESSAMQQDGTSPLSDAATGTVLSQAASSQASSPMTAPVPCDVLDPRVTAFFAPEIAGKSRSISDIFTTAQELLSFISEQLKRGDVLDLRQFNFITALLENLNVKAETLAEDDAEFAMGILSEIEDSFDNLQKRAVSHAAQLLSSFEKSGLSRTQIAAASAPHVNAFTARFESLRRVATTMNEERLDEMNSFLAKWDALQPSSAQGQAGQAPSITLLDRARQLGLQILRFATTPPDEQDGACLAVLLRHHDAQSKAVRGSTPSCDETHLVACRALVSSSQRALHDIARRYPLVWNDAWLTVNLPQAAQLRDLTEQLQEGVGDFFDNPHGLVEHLVTFLQTRAAVHAISQSHGLRSEVRSVLLGLLKSADQFYATVRQIETFAETCALASSRVLASKSQTPPPAAESSHVRVGDIVVGMRYWYTAEDINRLLTIGLKMLDVEHAVVLAASDDISGQQMLALRLRDLVRGPVPLAPGTILLCPYNTGNNHWVGAAIYVNEPANDASARPADVASAPAPYSIKVVCFDAQGVAIHAQLSNEIKTVFPNATVQPGDGLLQSDGSACGALLIENLINAARGHGEAKGRVDRERTAAIRARHVTWANELDKALPQMQQFAFRQANNAVLIPSLGAQRMSLYQMAIRALSDAETNIVSSLVVRLAALTDLVDSDGLSIRDKLVRAMQFETSFDNDAARAVELRRVIFHACSLAQNVTSQHRDALNGICEVLVRITYEQGVVAYSEEVARRASASMSTRAASGMGDSAHTPSAPSTHAAAAVARGAPKSVLDELADRHNLYVDSELIQIAGSAVARGVSIDAVLQQRRDSALSLIQQIGQAAPAVAATRAVPNTGASAVSGTSAKTGLGTVASPAQISPQATASAPSLVRPAATSKEATQASSSGLASSMTTKTGPTSESMLASQTPVPLDAPRDFFEIFNSDPSVDAAQFGSDDHLDLFEGMTDGSDVLE